jgi:alkylresorcinol/alkylpyrone synthase
MRARFSMRLRGGERFGRHAIAQWVMHAGGRRVLQEVRAALALEERDLAVSSAVLNDFGNLSSPFVLFVLDRALRTQAPSGLWWMSSFGAGFSCHGALLEVA